MKFVTQHWCLEMLVPLPIDGPALPTLWLPLECTYTQHNPGQSTLMPNVSSTKEYSRSHTLLPICYTSFQIHSISSHVPGADLQICLPQQISQVSLYSVLRKIINEDVKPGWHK